MNRKQFIESHGASCQNWMWSWSFVNHTAKFVIFGAWDIYEERDTVLIFAEEWATSRRGRKQPGYPQSREHIRLIEEEGYQLKTFPMEYAAGDEGDVGAPAHIKGFTPELTDKALLRIGTCWYASDDAPSARMPEEIAPHIALREGAAVAVSVNRYERNAEARRKCIEHHGYRCAACSFAFEDVYGLLGHRYIHVHHVVPLEEIDGEYEVDPVTDLVPICPNCHAMIHRASPALTIAQLKAHLAHNRALQPPAEDGGG